MNTGWTGGSFGNGGKRFSLSVTRQILNSVLENKIDKYKNSSIPFFNFMIPEAISGIDANILDPRIDRCNEDFDNQARELAIMFKNNFKRFNSSDVIIAAGPNV